MKTSVCPIHHQWVRRCARHISVHSQGKCVAVQMEEPASHRCVTSCSALIPFCVRSLSQSGQPHCYIQPCNNHHVSPDSLRSQAQYWTSSGTSLQIIFPLSLRGTNVSIGLGKLSIKNTLGITYIGPSNNMPCPSELGAQQHTLDASQASSREPISERDLYRQGQAEVGSSALHVTAATSGRYIFSSGSGATFWAM